ncbi:MAG: hypothetical protein JSW05_13080 [Candidatus Thorarchaeota archaeon]|nr:MAG: hypothetical protein JSW05_13080 [Candidatus Thorarchaeota archaeon]
MPVLEYLLIYTQSGLPIYSKCYGTFCRAAFKNPELLTGFLSAVETIPLTISSDFSLQSVKMGNSEMRFTKTTPGGHSVVIGLGEDAPDVANEVFSAVSETLASERFVNQDWSIISAELMASFEDELLKSSLPRALHDYGGFEDQCSMGDQCLIHTNASQSRAQRIWGAIKDKYAVLKKKMSGGI